MRGLEGANNAMEREQAAGPDERQFRISVPNTRACATLARQLLLQFVRSVHAGDDDLADIQVAAGEALANAAEHGERPAGKISVEAWLNDDCIEVEVSDDGPGFAPAPHPLAEPDVLSPRGFGLYLMYAVTDALEIRDGGTTVWFRKRFARGHARSHVESQTPALFDISAGKKTNTDRPVR